MLVALDDLQSCPILSDAEGVAQQSWGAGVWIRPSSYVDVVVLLEAVDDSWWPKVDGRWDQQRPAESCRAHWSAQPEKSSSVETVDVVLAYPAVELSRLEPKLPFDQVVRDEPMLGSQFE